MIPIRALATAAIVFAPFAGAQTKVIPERQVVENLRGPRDFMRMTGDMLLDEVVPSSKGTFKNASFLTNRWSMRDKDYELRPPADSYRIALLGSSFPVAGGVPVEKTHEVGAQPSMEEPELWRRLNPVSLDLVKWSYQRLAQICREHHTTVVGIAFPEPRRRGVPQLAIMSDLASEAGIPVLTLEGVYDGHPPASVTLKGDAHLNELGHQLVADRLFQLLRENDARTLKLDFPPVP